MQLVCQLPSTLRVKSFFFMTTVGTSDPTDTIRRTIEYMIQVRCTFDRRLGTSTVETTEVGDKFENFLTEGTSNFTATMKFYTTRDFLTIAPSPLQVGCIHIFL